MRTCSRCGKFLASTSPRTKRSSSTGSALIFTRLPQPVRVTRGEIEAVDRLERADLLQGGRRERCLALEGVQHDSLEQIAERQVELGSERLEHLEQPALEAHAGLGTADLLHAIMVPRYQCTIKSPAATATGPAPGRHGASALRRRRAVPWHARGPRPRPPAPPHPGPGTAPL